MTARARLALPEWATPTPPGWCARCGTAPGDPWHPHSVDGCLLRGMLVKPEDPAVVLHLAVQDVLQDVLRLGYSRPGGLLDPAIADRALAMIGTTVRAYTAVHGAS